MRFNPGLAQEQVDRLAEEVQPYRFPRELSALYRSRNGQPWGETFFWGCRLLPLDEAVSQWKLLRQIWGELDLGCPLWFPIANEGQDYFLAVLGEAEQETSLVLHSFCRTQRLQFGRRPSWLQSRWRRMAPARRFEEASPLAPVPTKAGRKVGGWRLA